jgi:hypothetical protein
MIRRGAVGGLFPDDLRLASSPPPGRRTAMAWTLLLDQRAIGSDRFRNTDSRRGADDFH